MSYRRGVVGVFQAEHGDILVCERSNRPGAWQFPQGGIDDGESPEETLLREIREELGTADFSIVRQSREWTFYDFPPEADFPLAQNFQGQTHLWFLLKFKPGAGPKLEASDGEFQAVRWVPLASCCDDVAGWKKDAYLQGMKLLGLF